MRNPVWLIHWSCRVSHLQVPRLKVTTYHRLYSRSFIPGQPHFQRLKALRRHERNESDSGAENDSTKGDVAEEEGQSWTTREQLKRKLLDDDDDEPAVRFYHQDFPWSKDRRRFDPNDPADADKTGQTKALKAELHQLENEIREMQEPRHGKTLIEPFLQDLPREDQQWIRDDIRKREVQEANRAKALERFLPTLAIQYDLPAHQRTYLQELNTSLRTSLLQFGKPNVRKQLWKSYMKCKSFLPPFLHRIPREAWIVLSRTQLLAFNQNDAHWATHSVVLFKDMQSAGGHLDMEQYMLFIEALKSENRFREGIEAWQALKETMPGGQKMLADYNVIGIRLHVLSGELVAAGRLASEYIKRSEDPNYRVLLPIIDGWIKRGDDASAKHAWAIYLSLRLYLKSDITISDYDSVHLSFLRGGRPDLAVAVFKDMMLTDKERSYDSTELGRELILSLEDQPLNTMKDSLLDDVSMSITTSLPRSLRNPYFYSKFIKRLIGLNEINLAAVIADLMRERNLTPAALHLNGIIGGWIRTATDDGAAKAELLAWAMVSRRLSFVGKREHGTSKPLPAQTAINERLLTVPKHTLRNLPAATIETFTLLLHFYSQRLKDEDLQVLQDALQAARISTDSKWYNQLMFIELRRENYGAVWELYLSKYADLTQPDLETFACLWQCELAQAEQTATCVQGLHSFPQPRRLMQEMATWHRASNGKWGSDMTLPSEMYDTIVDCTLQRSDLAGTIVVVLALQKMYGSYPTLSTTDLARKAVLNYFVRSKSSPSTPRTGRLARKKALLRTKEAESLSRRCLDLAQQEVERQFIDGGSVFGNSGDIQPRHEALLILVNYLKAVLQYTQPTRDVEESIMAAAAEMGIEGLRSESGIS